MSAQRTIRAHNDELGGIIGTWLGQLLAALAVVGLVAFEVIAVGIAAVSADDAAREVARATRDAYRMEQSLDRARATAREVAASRGAELVAVDEDGDVVSVTVEKRARTLIAHRLGPLQDVVTRPATSRAPVR